MSNCIYVNVKIRGVVRARAIKLGFFSICILFKTMAWVKSRESLKKRRLKAESQDTSTFR